MGRREKAALAALQVALPMAAAYAATGALGKQSKNIATGIRALSAAITAALADDAAPAAPAMAVRPGIKRAPKRAR